LFLVRALSPSALKPVARPGHLPNWPKSSHRDPLSTLTVVDVVSRPGRDTGPELEVTTSIKRHSVSSPAFARPMRAAECH
jgi:hypothetical protein